LKPLTNPEIYINRGLKPPSGLLLFGPPGCSKTLFAKALASTSYFNFISVKGPEIFSKYVGDSEKTIRDIFTKARINAPCVVFFDEIDAVGGRRGSEGSGGSSGVGERVLLQLLTEMDGFSEGQSIQPPKKDINKEEESM
jgi:ATP-dependent 26S proteasome regulatory subunit